MDKNWKINSTWDIALQHGQSAFRCLKIVKDIEAEYKLNKKQLNDLKYGESEYLRIIGQIDFLMRDHFNMCSTSVILFQSMMEALIHDSLEREDKLCDVKAQIEKANDRFDFKNKWKYSLKQLDREPQIFLDYNNEIYIKFRNKLIHPKIEEIDIVSKMTFKALFNGFKKGWKAYELLYDGLGHPHDENSWETMCRNHGLKKN